MGGMMIEGTRKLVALLTMTGTLLSPAIALGQAAPAPAVAPPAASVPVPSGYVLGVGDTVEVAVDDNADYKGKVTIEQDGTVVLPLLGRVTAAGQSVTQFRETVRTRLVSGGYFVKPEVSVTLVSATSRYATILGEVSSPGLVTLDRDYHLSEVIARVGGLKGAGVDAITLTTADGQTRTYSMRQAATTGGNADPLINPGDKIFIAPAQVFYIYGQVSAPGSYPVDPNMSVRQALARGGGLTALGSSKKVMLTRGDRDIKVTLDEKIQPGDTLVIGQRFF